MSTVNTQVIDSVTDTNTTIIGNAPAEGFALLDTVMAETVGMLMHNAVNTQTNAQMIGNAAVTATCARMLSVPAPVPTLKPDIPILPIFSPSGGSPSDSSPPTGSPAPINVTPALNQLAKDAATAGSDEALAMKNLQALADAARNGTATN